MIAHKKEPDYFLLSTVLLLLAIGILMILSSSASVGLRIFNDSYYFIKKHFIYLVLGLGAFAFGFSYPYSNYKKITIKGLIISLLLLLCTYIPGLKINAGGASRWINLGLFSFQPAELVKFFLIVFIANAASNKKERIKDFILGIFPILLMVGLVSLFILKQPDLGTTIVIFFTTFAMLFAAGANILHLILLALVSFRSISWLIMRTPYQRQRFLAFLNPWQDSLGKGFHIVQSLLAVGSGGFWGVGLGQSRQKFAYLPQQFTDFIFAIICEEGGFIAGTFVIVLYLTFTIRGYRIANNTSDRFGQLLAIGLTFMISCQAMINILVVLGLSPTTGITLPFISFGGTSLIMSLFFVGVLTNISKT